MLQVGGLLGQRVLIEKVPDVDVGGRKRTRVMPPLHIHAALLAPFVAGEPDLIYEPEPLDPDPA